MSQIYLPSATEHGSYVLPSDGDPAVAESVNQALRDLADSALNANSAADAAAALAAQMINGVTGGTYAPATPITITDSGVVIDAGFGGDLVVQGLSTLSVPGSLTASVGGVVVASALTVTSSFVTVSEDTNTTFNGDVVIEDLTTGTSLQANGDVTLGNGAADTTTVEATSTFEAPATFNDGARVNGTLVVSNLNVNQNTNLGNSSSDTITATGTVVLKQPLEYSGVGRVGFRPPVILPNASATVGIEDGDLFIVEDNIGAGRSYSISTDGAEPGDRITVQYGSTVGAGLNNAVTFSFVGDVGINLAANTHGGFSVVYVTGRTAPGSPDGWYIYSET